MTPWDNGFDGARTGLEHESTGTLIGELVGEAKLLVREEVRLAKSELREDVQQAAAGAALMGVAGVVGHAAFFCLVGALVLGLSYVMPLWASALLVGVVLAGAAAILAVGGAASFKKIGLEETIETVREDGEWASETMHAARSRRHADA